MSTAPIKNNLGDLFLKQKAATQTKIIVIIIGVMIFIATVMYIYTKSTYRQTHCKVINDIYSDMGRVQSINLQDNNFKDHLLRDFYIKSSYNSCAIGDFQNTFVDTCALKQVIRQGVRVLDFEIYSVGNKPVIAVSSIPCNWNDPETEKQCYLIKESYNMVDFSNAMQIINSYAFSGDTSPNPNDPLFLHFRIRSANDKIYSIMSDSIRSTFTTKLLGKQFSFENNGHSLAIEPIKNLVNKVIIIVDRSNPAFEDSPLDELVNIASNSVFMRGLREKDVRYTPDFNELVDFNKKNMTLELPNVSANDKNPSAALAQKYGVQMVAMNYQNYDSNLEYNEEFFAKAGYAFVLKPAELRYTITTIPPPNSQNPALSYANRQYKSDYFNFTI